ncbi:MAG: hypothetical protein ABSE21_01800 [Bryobacteraceae bacterium]|jgi:hypothetical protein
MVGKRISRPVPLLLLIAVAAKMETPKCAEDTSIQFVAYCDLVHAPAKFDGHLVRTDAVWQRMIHAGALADRACASSSSEPLLTLPSFSEHSNFNSSLRRELWNLLGKDGAAHVRVVGMFHGPKRRLYAADGQRFQIEIECLLSVTPLKPSEKSDLPSRFSLPH